MRRIPDKYGEADILDKIAVRGRLTASTPAPHLEEL
jgi:hypothetical protein